MVPPDLISYIREQSAQGVAAVDLRETLINAGWSEFDVENALHDVAVGLEPLTQGASLHEDVAQVRGLVTHLALRVKRLEARLVDTQMLTMPTEIPQRTMESPQAVTDNTTPALGTRIVSVLGAAGVLAAFGFYFQTLVEKSQQAPMAFLQVASLVGLLHLLLAWLLMRRRRAFGAELATATAVAFWSVTIWHAQRTYHFMEPPTAVALGVLLFVLLLVMGRWIDRYAEGSRG